MADDEVMTAHPGRIADLADRLFTTIEEGDTEALAAMWADDIVVWRSGGGRERDKTRALAVIDWFVAVTAQRRYEVLDRQVFDGGFVQQHLLHARGNAGTEVTFRACLVVKVGDDGVITRIDEYLDPADLAPLAKEL
jgi:ketosteroid isomerase-like protein